MLVLCSTATPSATLTLICCRMSAPATTTATTTDGLHPTTTNPTRNDETTAGIELDVTARDQHRLPVAAITDQGADFAGVHRQRGQPVDRLSAVRIDHQRPGRDPAIPHVAIELVASSRRSQQIERGPRRIEINEVAKIRRLEGVRA